MDENGTIHKEENVNNVSTVAKASDYKDNWTVVKEGISGSDKDANGNSIVYNKMTGNNLGIKHLEKKNCDYTTTQTTGCLQYCTYEGNVFETTCTISNTDEERATALDNRCKQAEVAFGNGDLGVLTSDNVYYFEENLLNPFGCVIQGDENVVCDAFPTSASAWAYRRPGWVIIVRLSFLLRSERYRVSISTVISKRSRYSLISARWASLTGTVCSGLFLISSSRRSFSVTSSVSIC